MSERGEFITPYKCPNDIYKTIRARPIIYIPKGWMGWKAYKKKEQMQEKANKNAAQRKARAKRAKNRHKND